MVIRGKLLESLTSEGVAIVRNKVGDAVAEIANQYTEHGIIFFFFSSFVRIHTYCLC